MRENNMFSGCMVALITPFHDGEVDFQTLDELVEFHLKSGTDAIVPVGTTGESPTLDYEEHKQVIERVVRAVEGRIPVIAGTGSNSTAEAIELTAHAKKVGADASLQVCPYYNKPTQEGFYQHFKAIAEEVDIPLVLYNIPGRCGAGMTPDTIVRLAEIENIVAIKEATGSLDQASGRHQRGGQHRPHGCQGHDRPDPRRRPGLGAEVAQQAVRAIQEFAEHGDQSDPDQGRDGDARDGLRRNASADGSPGRRQAK
jgi:dihydrodipicolinate synthase/N-acetylneuraminate lyase